MRFAASPPTPRHSSGVGISTTSTALGPRDGPPGRPADRRALHRRPTWPALPDAEKRSGLRWPLRSDSVQQFLRPRSETSPNIDAPALRSGSHRENRTRSGQEPHQTPSTTDQRLCYEPRRLQMSSHTPNNPAVTSSTSANTPTNRIYSYLAGRLSGRLVSGSGRWGVPPPTNTVSAVGGAPSRTAARPSSARTAASQPSGLAAPNSAGV